MAEQLIKPNPNIPCTPGLCLVYVRQAFGIGPKHPTATDGWNASNYKHIGKNFPDGMWVPMWFSLSDNSAGHVALRQPDGSIWSASSATAKTPVHHPDLKHLEGYYGGRLKYLGWTEDLENVRIVDVNEHHAASGNTIDSRTHSRNPKPVNSTRETSEAVLAIEALNPPVDAMLSTRNNPNKVGHGSVHGKARSSRVAGID